MLRLHYFCLLIPLLATPPSAGAEAPPAVSDTALLRVAFGVLQKHKTDSGGDRYVLVDGDGQVRYSVSPSDGVPLEENVGKSVQIVGQFDGEPDSEQPLLLAQRIEAKIAPPAQFADLQSVASDDQDSLPPLTPIPSPGSSAGGSETTRTMPGIILEDELLDESLLGEGGMAEAGEPETLLPAPDRWHFAPCGAPERVWGQISALAWWTREMTLPPLVTTSPIGTPQSQAGVLGASGTEVLFGGDDVFTDLRYGTQVRVGGWLGPRRWVGLEFDYTGLQDESTRFVAVSVGDQILARPFLNVGPNTLSYDSALVAFPNLLAGTVLVDADSRFQSAGFHLLTNILCTSGCQLGARRELGSSQNGFRLDLVGGYRYINLDESVTIRDYLVTTVTPRTGLLGFDQFATGNDFHGGELGLNARYQRRRWWAEGLLRVALGRTEESIAIRGATQVVVPPDAQNGSATQLEGGLLAQTTNIGDWSQREFAWAPELGLTCGYELTPQLSVKFGYSLLFLSRVMRPDGAIDLGVNETYIPDPTDPELVPVGPARPAVAFNDTNYWAQGFQLGLDYRW